MKLISTFLFEEERSKKKKKGNTVICDKYPLVQYSYSSTINNSDQAKLITPYFRTTVGVSSLAYHGYTKPGMQFQILLSS